MDLNFREQKVYTLCLFRFFNQQQQFEIENIIKQKFKKKKRTNYTNIKCCGGWVRTVDEETKKKKMNKPRYHLLYILGNIFKERLQYNIYHFESNIYSISTTHLN